jgi:cysteine-rich repeat protein
MRLVRHACWFSIACGVADTGLLLCPPGTTSTADGCAPIGPRPDGGPDGIPGLRVAGDLAFGFLAVGGARTRTLEITNLFDQPIRLTVVGLQGSPAFQIDGLLPGFQIPLDPNDRFVIPVRYQPENDGFHGDRLELRTCDSELCAIQIDAMGIGVERALACDDVDLGRTLPGTCAGARAECRNATDYPLTFVRGGVDGPPTLIVQFPPPDTVVGARETLALDVRFCPAVSGRHIAEVEMILDAQPSLTRTTFELRGDASEENATFECAASVSLMAPVGGVREGSVECATRGGSTLVESVRFPPGTTPDLSAYLTIGGVGVPLPYVVNENDVVAVRVTFAPTAPLRHDALLFVEHEWGQDAIQVSADTTVGACNLIVPAVIDFGRVPIGTIASAFAPLESIGQGDCTITPQIAADPGISLLFPPPGGTFTLGPGDQVEIQAQLAPAAIRTYTATAILDVAELGQQVPFLLLGEGVLAADCGNGFVDAGEQCDDGNPINTDDCVACATAGCLDGFLHVNREECDDGNANGSDACDNTCSWNQPGYGVSTLFQPLVPHAGAPIVFQNPDDAVAQIVLPFPFAFAGSPVTTAYVSTNGIVAFRPQGAGTFVHAPIPAAPDPNGFIAWWWTDLHLAQPGVMSSATATVTGVAPARVQRFTFVDVTGFTADTPLITAEIRLFEGTNVIEVHYADLVPRANDFEASAGFESLSGTYGQDVLGCGAQCASLHWPTDTLYRYVPTF